MNFRFARHTHKIAEISKFYTEILGFEILGEFKNHEQYDGVFIGKINCDWHLEFTSSPDIPDHTFDEDDLIVFYPKTETEYKQIINNIEISDIEIKKAKNPYWNENGILVKDPDDFGIIISPLKIEK